MGPKQALPLQVRVDLGVMAIKEYSTFSQSSRPRASLSDGLVSYPEHSLWWWVLHLCKDAVGIFYSFSWLGCPDQGVAGWNVVSVSVGSHSYFKNLDIKYADENSYDLQIV